MTDVIDYRFRMRRGFATTWASQNGILLEAEIGLEKDTGRFKIGDGVTRWNSLPYNVSGTVHDFDGIANGDVLTWDATNERWKPAAPGGGIPASVATWKYADDGAKHAVCEVAVPSEFAFWIYGHNVTKSASGWPYIYVSIDGGSTFSRVAGYSQDTSGVEASSDSALHSTGATAARGFTAQGVVAGGLLSATIPSSGGRASYTADISAATHMRIEAWAGAGVSANFTGGVIQMVVKQI